MVKKLILFGCALMLVVAAVVFYGLSNLGPIIKRAVNTYGPGVTQTEVKLGDAGVSLFSGEVKLKDFLVGNPQGFKSPRALTGGSVYLDVDEKSLTGNPVVIDQIDIVAPEITYETTGRDDNFNALLRNVKKQTRKAQSGGGTQKTVSGGGAAKGGGPKLLIRSLVIREGRVNLTAAPLAGQTVTAELPYIEMQNVGGEKNGVTPEKAFHLILATLYEQIQSPEVTAALSKGLESLGVTVKGISVKGFEGKTKEVVENAKQKLKGLLGD